MCYLAMSAAMYQATSAQEQAKDLKERRENGKQISVGE
jgi:hypothetical protein